MRCDCATPNFETQHTCAQTQSPAPLAQSRAFKDLDTPFTSATRNDPPGDRRAIAHDHPDVPHSVPGAPLCARPGFASRKLHEPARAVIPGANPDAHLS